VHWTRWASLSAGMLGLAGCGYGYQMVSAQPRYSAASRPAGSYFCYDCHGYRYFDPYYDYCVARGYRYDWNRNPEAMAAYRERYVGIRENHPDYGRYRYREGYRASARYKDGGDYEAARGETKPAPPEHSRSKHREKDGKPAGKKDHKGDAGKDPRDHGSRLSLPGGET
jgi:hypothetical protein